MSEHDEPDFKLIGRQGDRSGNLLVRYGSGPNDPIPFILQLTPQYVAREIGKTPPVKFAEMLRYAEQNADELEAKARFEKGQRRTTLVLE